MHIVAYLWKIFICKNRNSTPIELLPFHPLPLLLETTILLSVSKSLTILDTSREWIHAVFVFCDWFLSFSLMSSRFISVAAHDRISSLFYFLNIFIGV